MKTILVAAILGFCLIGNIAAADREITVRQADIAFVLPDKWDPKTISGNRSPPKMDRSDPLYLGWKRAPIVDSAGHRVFPGMNMVVYYVAQDTDVTLTSAMLMHRRGWPFKKFLTSADYGLKLPHSLGYLTEYSPRKGIVLKLFVIHAVNDGKFVEIILSATREVFPLVEGEFRSIIQSLRLTAIARLPQRRYLVRTFQ